MVVFLNVEMLEDFGFSFGSCITLLSLILNFPNWLISINKSLGFSAMIFLIYSKIFSNIISVACFSISASLEIATLFILIVGKDKSILSSISILFLIKNFSVNPMMTSFVLVSVSSFDVNCTLDNKNIYCNLQRE